MPTELMASTMLALILAASFSLHASAQVLTATNDPAPNGVEYELDLAMSDQKFTLNPLTDASSITVRLLSPQLPSLAKLHHRKPPCPVS